MFDGIVIVQIGAHVSPDRKLKHRGRQRREHSFARLQGIAHDGFVDIAASCGYGNRPAIRLF